MVNVVEYDVSNLGFETNTEADVGWLNDPFNDLWDYTNETSTGFTRTNSAVTFVGHDLTYDLNGVPLTGTLTGVSDIHFAASGFSLTIAQWYALYGVNGIAFTKNFLAGNDVITGTPGNDTLFGEGGNDRIIGGHGQDTMSGGPGRDIFVFNSIHDSVYFFAPDLITDFTHGVDKIDVSAIDANTHLPGNNRFTFLAAKGAKFTHHAGQLVGTSSAMTRISRPTSTVMPAPTSRFQLTGHHILTAGDFFL